NGREGAAAGIGVWFGEGDARNVSAPLKGESTNNRAEVAAVIEAMKIIGPGVNAEIRTDSKYVLAGVGNIEKWRAAGWKMAAGTVASLDLWRALDRQIWETQSLGGYLVWSHVVGHQQEIGNIEADRLAIEGARKPIAETHSHQDADQGWDRSQFLEWW